MVSPSPKNQQKMVDFMGMKFMVDLSSEAANPEISRNKNQHFSVDFHGIQWVFFRGFFSCWFHGKLEELHGI